MSSAGQIPPREPSLKVELCGQPDDLDLAVGLLDGIFTGAVELEPDSAGRARLEVYLPAADRPAAEKALEPASVEISHWLPVPEEEWELQWRDAFTPVPVGGGMTVVPEWDTDTEAAILLRLRPGMAFGTGHHASTWLLCEMLTGLNYKDATVLDLGAGSGILSIAAALLGARSTLSVEHDPSCRKNFLDNLALNKVAATVTWRLSDVKNWDRFHYDIMLANIHRAVIFPLLERFGKSSSGGDLLVSGLLKTEESPFLELCAQHGLTVVDLKHDNDWFAAQARTHAGEK